MRLAAALRESFQKGYNGKDLTQDLLAGLVVSLVALPLAMALSIAVGLPPQHGLYTAIAAGFITPLLGGSKAQVSGPTAAFVVILAPIVTELGLRGIIWCQILAGLILLALGLARLGRYVNYVPYPVTTGFTAGIAVVIATLSLKDFLGLDIGHFEDSYIGKLDQIGHALPAAHLWEAAIGVFTLVIITCLPRLNTRIPSPVAGIAAASLLGWALGHYFHIDIATISSRFSYSLPDGTTAPGIPPFPPVFHFPGGDDPLFALPGFDELRLFLMPAVVIAALAALESLLSATVADSLAGTRHNPNAELNGIGIGNIVSAMFLGIPATGAIARTAANIHAGARSPLASSFHAIFLLLYVMFFAPLIGYVPMSALAALLLVVAYRMSHAHQFVTIMKIAPGSDRLTLLVCFLLTVFIDMVAGVSIGFILATLLLMKRVSELTKVTVTPLAPQGVLLNTEELKKSDTLVFHIHGPLFFGSVEKALERSGLLDNPHWKKLVIDLGNVPLIDMTGMVAIQSLLRSVATGGREVVLKGSADILAKITHSLPQTLAQKIALEQADS